LSRQPLRSVGSNADDQITLIVGSSQVRRSTAFGNRIGTDLAEPASRSGAGEVLVPLLIAVLTALVMLPARACATTGDAYACRAIEIESIPPTITMTAPIATSHHCAVRLYHPLTRSICELNHASVAVSSLS